MSDTVVPRITFTDKYGEYIIIRAVRNGSAYNVLIDTVDVGQSNHNWHITARGYVERSVRTIGIEFKED